MKIDVETSTVEIDDRRFPAVCLICPPYGDNPDPDRERILGGPAIPMVGPRLGRLTYQAIIPCENGVLIAVEWHEDADPTAPYYITLESRTCELSTHDKEGPLWLPHTVGIYEGRLEKLRKHSVWAKAGAWYWHHALPDWTVEFIDRFSKLPYDEPPGPQVQLIALKKAHKMLDQYVEEKYGTID